MVVEVNNELDIPYMYVYIKNKEKKYHLIKYFHYKM